MEKKALPSTAHLCSLLPSGCHSYNNMTGTGFEETELNHPEIQQESLLGCCGASRKTYLNYCMVPQRSQQEAGCFVEPLLSVR